jgi:histone deacetylase 1/2
VIPFRYRELSIALTHVHIVFKFYTNNTTKIQFSSPSHSSNLDHQQGEVDLRPFQSMTSRSRVAYYYDEEIGNFYYDEGHPMKPVRVRMTHSLVLAYGLHQYMQVFRPRRATPVEMMHFHSPEYVKFLQNATAENTANCAQELDKFCLGLDCPVFDDLFEYCQISAGGSISAAQRLNAGLCDIAINWAGGLHHARKAQASGFCYIADCVLVIM